MPTEQPDSIDTRFDENTREAIFKASFEASLRLVRCGENQRKIMLECERLEQDYKPSGDPRVITIPPLVGLQHDAESFLYETKNFIRDMTKIINKAFGTQFEQASEFCNIRGTGDAKITSWAEKQFGTDDSLTEFLRLHQAWIGEVVQMRNAIEHPRGHSGMLQIRNFELMPDGSIRRPVWYRNDDPPSPLVDEMAGLCDQMLQMADELIALIIQRHLRAPIFQLYMVPDDQRDLVCPKSFTIGLTAEAARKLQRQAKRGN